MSINPLRDMSPPPLAPGTAMEAGGETSIDLAKANEVMQRVNRSVAEARDIRSALPFVLQEICGLIGNRSAAVYRYDDQCDALVFVCGYGDGRAVTEFEDHPYGRPGMKLRVSEFPGWQSLLDSPDGRFIVVEPGSSPPPMGAWHASRGHKLLLRTLLKGKDGPLGMLGLAFKHERLPDASRMALYDSLAQTVTLIVQIACLAEEARTGAIAREREYAMTQRALEAQNVSRILEGVVAASRALLDEPNLDDGLARWLGLLAQAACAEGAFFGVLGNRGGPAAIKTQQWHIDGVEQPEDVPPTSDFMDWVGRIARGESVWSTKEDLVDPESIAFWTLQGINCMLLLPVVVEGTTVAWVAFSWRERRPCNGSWNAALKTAADAAAAAILRQRSLAAVAAEREKAQREKLSMLTQSNDALRSSLDALAEAGSEDGFIQRAMVEIASSAACEAAYLFRSTSEDHLLRLVGSAKHGRFSATGEPDDPPQFRQGILPQPQTMARLIKSGRLIVRNVESEPDQHGASTLEWHRRQGHRSNALHVLAIGTRVVGLVGMVFRDEAVLEETVQEHIHGLCQPLALALELARLAKVAQRNAEHAAVLTERTRLAREIHDGIAQSLLGIQMQLDTSPDAPDAARRWWQAQMLARHGLHEARRAVSALRPRELMNSSLPQGLRHLVARLTAGSGLQFTIDAPSDWKTLGPNVDDQLFRIVQESVNNVIRHAKASQLRIELSQDRHESTILIADDGCGFDVSAVEGLRSFGVDGMRQRVRLIGGAIQWLSRIGEGTDVLVSVPTVARLDAPDHD